MSLARVVLRLFLLLSLNIVSHHAQSPALHMYQWAIKAGGPGSVEITSMAVSSDGKVAIVGVATTANLDVYDKSNVKRKTFTPSGGKASFLSVFSVDGRYVRYCPSLIVIVYYTP